MSAAALQSDVQTSHGSTDEDDGYKHLANQDDIQKSIISGGTVTALCGKKMIFRHDPGSRPLCRSCEDLMGVIEASDMGSVNSD